MQALPEGVLLLTWYMFAQMQHHIHLWPSDLCLDIHFGLDHTMVPRLSEI